MSEREARFLFDRMLGKLCRKMRLLGYDSKLNPEGQTGRFLLNAEREGRIPVTMAKRRKERPGPPPVILESTGIKEQIAELFAKIKKAPSLRPFSRCLECNEPLAPAKKEEVLDKVPEFVAEHFERFFVCPDCGRVYWEGTHFSAMKREIESIKGKLKEKGFL